MLRVMGPGLDRLKPGGLCGDVSSSPLGKLLTSRGMMCGRLAEGFITLPK